MVIDNMKLRPCPFCGGDARNGFAGGKSNGIHSVHCTTCGASIGMLIIVDAADVKSIQSTEEHAIHAWNKRSNAGEI